MPSTIFSLDDILASNQFELSVRAYNVCLSVDLTDTQKLLAYYKKENGFKRLRSVGKKTHEELELICKKLLLDETVERQPETTRKITLLSDVFRTQEFELSKRAYNICFVEKIIDLKQLVEFYIAKKDFSSLKNAGEKTKIELEVICNKILSDTDFLEFLFADEEEKKILQLPEIPVLSSIQNSIANLFIKKLLENLSTRTSNSLKTFLKGNITISNILVLAAENKINVKNLDNTGKKTMGEVDFFLSQIDTYGSLTILAVSHFKSKTPRSKMIKISHIKSKPFDGSHNI
ncbi:MAG: hypothetical protein RLZZ292_3115, partial [Bacteroidota bacterium]